jgi:hypothetical protein
MNYSEHFKQFLDMSICSIRPVSMWLLSVEQWDIDESFYFRITLYSDPINKAYAHAEGYSDKGATFEECLLKVFIGFNAPAHENDLIIQ